MTVDDALLDTLWENPDSDAHVLSRLLAKRGILVGSHRIAMMMRVLTRRGYKIVKTKTVTRRSKTTYRLLQRHLEKPRLYYKDRMNGYPKHVWVAVEMLDEAGPMVKMRYNGLLSNRPVTLWTRRENIVAMEASGV